MRSDDAAASITDLIDLEKVEENLYRGTCHPGAPLRAFGGQVAAQALVAAGTTVASDRLVHSLHGYFIRAGRTDRPIVYGVDRTRDGRSFTTRRVVAIQDGVAIFSLSASFHRPEESPEHQAAMPAADGPEGLPDGWDAEVGTEGPAVFGTVLETRCATGLHTGLPDVGQGPRQELWVRARGTLADPPLLHACVLTYISDIRLALTATLPHLDGPEFPPLVSLDHALWFHRPFRADEWLLFAMDGPSYASSRGLSRGQFFTRDGRLVASVVQEGLFRKPVSR
ncbi:acyl-CoA thioesterase II [Streptomyces sp. NBC_00656]|uniref:acyl-CoA thioesterase n=1 Tax=Streptomyces sp. NBC_00656 TaxID=2903668 RepID=UPI003254419C